MYLGWPKDTFSIIQVTSQLFAQGLPSANKLTHWYSFLLVSGRIENLIKPGSSFEHVARWLTFCGAQPPFCNVSEKLQSQAQNDNSQLGVSVCAIKVV